jgi:hemerythrin
MDWGAEFSIGIPEIDRQHRAIVDCIGLLQDAVTAGERWSTVNGALGRLSDCVRNHFAVEESLMRIMDYPELGRHAEEHQKFAAKLQTMHEDSLKGNFSDEMLEIIDTWLRHHMLGSDKSYAWFFRQVVTPPSESGIAKVKRWWSQRLMPRHISS